MPVVSAFAVPPCRRVPDARRRIREANQRAGTQLVVLDDDPTGCQSVGDVPILTDWSEALLADALADHDLIFVLTNSRAYPAARAAGLTRELAERLTRQVPAHRLRLLSRSDSTLRGHFAAEVGTLLDEAGPFDGVLVVPFFQEGGRYTRHGTHYVVRGDDWTEAHRTEFAQDPVFGYTTSYLPDWLEQKSAGRWRAEAVLDLSVEDIRLSGPARVTERLVQAQGGQPVVVDALEEADLEVVTLGLIEAERRGKRFLYRTAASFVKIRAGQDDRALVVPPGAGGAGLIVVGSHVQQTTEQLRVLLDHAPLHALDVTLSTLFSGERDAYQQRLAAEIDEVLAAGRSVVVYTERAYALTGTAAERLRAGEVITDFLCGLVARLRTRPDFVVAKGGITSLEVARQGLGMRRGTVLGAIEPGVPLWQLGADSRYPGLRYVVFPGNVGAPDSLLRVYQTLSRPTA